MNIFTLYYYKYRKIINQFKKRFKRRSFLRKLKRKFKPTSNTQRILIQRLEFAIQNNITYLIPIQNYRGYRGIGKTYAIIYLALKYNLPILVDNKKQKKYMEEILRYENINRNDIKIMTSSDNIRGVRTLLIDVYQQKSFEQIKYKADNFGITLIGITTNNDTRKKVK